MKVVTISHLKLPNTLYMRPLNDNQYDFLAEIHKEDKEGLVLLNLMLLILFEGLVKIGGSIYKTGLINELYFVIKSNVCKVY
jgi:hypothetical protein